MLQQKRLRTFSLQSWKPRCVIFAGRGGVTVYSGGDGFPPMKPFKRSGSMFVVEDTTDGKLTVELGVDFDRRPAVNHFRTTSRYYTSDHEYRIDGTSVFCRLMEDRHGGPGVSEYKDVRDGWCWNQSSEQETGRPRGTIFMALL